MSIEDLVKAQLKPGKYVIAVSGGVDSVTLLDIVSKQKDVEVIVAHLDHGIRSDSRLDQELVNNLAKQYGFLYVTKSLNLGSNASEQLARNARYKFLLTAMKKHNAVAIITAHHSDDVIETSIFNLLRGTGRKGLTSLNSTDIVIRPLLGTSKDQIKKYALDHNLVWREDSTNKDLKYSRNKIRYQLANTKNKTALKNLKTRINQLEVTNKLIDDEIDSLLDDMATGQKLNRLKFISLPHKLALEILASWLRLNNISSFDSKLLNTLLVAAKTYKDGSLIKIIQI
jgi:tRNA(Ile)-lysidine synthase